MTTKLTLSVKPEIKQLAERIAKQKGKSISGLISQLIKDMEANTVNKKNVDLGDLLHGVAKTRGKKPGGEDFIKMVLEKHSRHIKK